MKATQAAREQRLAIDDSRSSTSRTSPSDDSIVTLVAVESQTRVKRSAGGRRSMVSEYSDSVFFRHAAVAAVAPFVAKLTRQCIAPNDFTQVSFRRWKDDVALLFVDISGYSKLASALSSAHALAEAVNGYFKPIVDIVLEFGGDILKFAGDAMMVIWPVSKRRPIQQCCHEALACAMRMQKDCGSHFISKADATLKLHIGMTAGKLDADVFMPKSTSKLVMQKAYFFVGGAALKGINDIVDASPPGSVGVAPNIKALVNESVVKLELLEEGILRCISVVEPSVLQSRSKLRTPNVSINVSDSINVPDAFSAPGDNTDDFEGSDSDEDDVDDRIHQAQVDEYFVPPAVLSRLRMGLRTQDMAEMRHLYCLFIQKTGDMDITDWFDEVYEILNAGRCPITQVIEDDKGVHVVAAMNLYVAEEGAADAAVYVAQQLVRREVSCVVGIAGGSCFCGIVGSEQVCRWDITGSACVRACRLMQFAAANGLVVAVDSSVREKCKDASSLRTHNSEVSIKGSSDPISVFTLRAQTDTAINSIAAVNDYCKEVRAAERQKLLSNLIHRDDISSGGALVVGPANAGKKYLILSALHNTSFTPLLHRTMRECSKLDICRSIAEWFEYHPNEKLRSLATAIRQAQTSQHTSKAMQLTLELVQLSVDLGLHTALVVDRTQYLDDASLRMVAKCIRVMAEDVSRTSRAEDVSAKHAKGRWLWMFSMTPLLQGQSSAFIQSLGAVSMTITLGELGLQELGALWTYFSFWKMDDESLLHYSTATNFLPGQFIAFMLHIGPIFFRTMAMSRRGMIAKEELYVDVMSEGTSRLSDRGGQLVVDTPLKTAAPHLVSRAIQYFDVLHPRQQIVLKVVACITSGGIRCRWKIVCAVAAHFLPRVTSEMLLHDMITLRELLLLKLDDKKDDGLCSVASAPILEAVFDTLTPMQLKLVAKKYLELGTKDMSADADFPIQDLEDFAALAHRADMKDRCVQLLRMAWQKCSQAMGGKHQQAGRLRITDTQHRLATSAEAFGIDLKALEVDGKIPASLPAAPYSLDGKNQLPIAIAFVKNAEPPLALGPMAGMVVSLCYEVTNNFIHMYDAPKRTHYVPVQAESYLALVRKFRASVAANPDPSTHTSMTAQEEEDFVRSCLTKQESDEKALHVAQAMNKYLEEVIAPRCRRVTFFANSLRTFVPKDEADMKRCKTLLRVFEMLSDVTDTTPADIAAPKARAALMALAVENWQSPYPYLIPAKLRDEWLSGTISVVELKAIVFLFLLQGTDGRIIMTREEEIGMDSEGRSSWS